MIPVTLAELAGDANAHVAAHGAEIVGGVSTDTRTLRAGDVFVAIQGERVDGASLAGKALDAGACAVLTSNPDVAIASGATEDRLVVVDDVIRALGDIARGNLVRARQANPDLQVVAVTGSVGKTTTKDLLADVLAERGPIIAPPGSFNNELGLPLTVLRADGSTATLVLEMGADHIGNISYLTRIAPPDLGVVLIVARAHLGEFGGIENVAKAKSEMVTGVRDGGSVVLNADDERVVAMAGLASGSVRTFSAAGDSSADVWASDVTIDDDGHASFLLHSDGTSEPVHLGLIGAHHVGNALAAASVARELGLPLSHIARTLSHASPASPHRMAVSDYAGMRIIDDSYNANPDSMRAGISGLGVLGHGRRRVAVLGTMLELGEASDHEHAALAPLLQEAGVDILLCVGEGTASLSSASRELGIETHDATDWTSALAILDTVSRSGDVILLKGSNGSGVWKIADALHERGL
ncbi:UDP-N-acetylmuramoyl-tripeptide--D-alanyl-D-alanine ligase [Arcanobacterium haemolyticum]|nr:UDP-N-acetylmuramoyl-tripeptide--D-alanyl-D-alanine ligase [Arcanobacterium haemolyticum]